MSKIRLPLESIELIDVNINTNEEINITDLLWFGENRVGSKDDSGSLDEWKLYIEVDRTVVDSLNTA